MSFQNSISGEGKGKSNQISDSGVSHATSEIIIRSLHSSTSERIPPEIFLHIFEELLDGAYHQQFSPRISWNAWHYDSEYSYETNPGLECLARVARVCKSWLTLSTPILYKHPLLISRQQIIHFAETIEHNSVLASHVHQLCTLTPDGGVDPRRASDIPPVWKEYYKAIIILSEVIQHCTNLHTLVNINSTIPSPGILVNDCLPPYVRIRAHLRTLTLLSHDYGDVFSVSTELFPELRVLTLGCAYIAPADLFRSFPALQTLRLTRCRRVKEEEDFIVNRSCFPSLVNLDLFHNAFNVFISFESYTRLRSLGYLAHDMSFVSRVSGFANDRNGAHLNTIRHLTLGTRVPAPYDFLHHTVFPKLETLEIFVPFVQDGVEIMEQVLQSIGEALNKGRQPSLQDLLIHVLTFSDVTLTMERSIFRTLRNSCIESEITLHLDTIERDPSDTKPLTEEPWCVVM